ncbi:MAG: DUF1837 domain-containing protein [Actinomycetaceae bacterium]|nr:DUF1837 domain-containing protein [Actinomycetaceae bacterium]
MSEAPEPILPLSLLAKNRDKFMALFYEPTSTALQTKTNLHLHILRVRNGDFDLPGLYRELKGNSAAYVLSRLNYQKVLDDPSLMMEVASKVQSQFRKPEKSSGEGGEVILYSLLEGHLGAPKVLSKMELKTSSDHYVHGSDGVHLLRVDDGSYQLIFGESKMYGDAGTLGASVKRGIKAAFESIGKVHEEGFDFDTWLVDSELLKEQLDPEKLEALSAIILPSDGGSGIKKHNAFGIFVGYEVDVSDIKSENMELNDIETELKKRAVDAIAAEHDLIRSEIANRGLGVYPFHIYAIPFAKRGSGKNASGIEKVRMELAAQLGNREVPKK